MRARGRLGIALALAAGAAWAGLAGAGSALAGGTLELDPVGDFDQPMYVATAPGDTQHLYVVERGGKVKVVNKDGSEEQTFLNISDLVSSVGDRGLHSIAFDPHFQRNGLLYAHYSDADFDVRIDEFHANSPFRASPKSRRTVLHVNHPHKDDHFGGTLQFGEDGHLYISVGDSGCCGDPGDKARKLNTLLGKILRIDPRRAHRKPYTVPKSNPYVGRNGKEEIYSYGLRNPFRFTLDPDANAMVIGDVGQDAYEEIDYTKVAGAKGTNFGWPAMEGTHEYDPGRPGPGPPLDPIFDYPHSDPGGGAAHGCAVIAGPVVRDAQLPSLEGDLLYTDYCNGDLRALTPHTSGATNERSLGLDVGSPAGFGEGRHGEIYIADLLGTVWHLVETP
jgi:glucose/arabinose dehydrogenase